MKIEYQEHKLILKNTFTINHGSRDFQSTFIIKISDGHHTGHGEAAAAAYYGATFEHMKASVMEIEEILKANISKTPEELWELTYPILKKDLFAQCALDIALHDLNGRRLGLPLYQLWGLDPEEAPVTNYTIGIDSLDVMVRKLKEFPWPLYKIKLGTEDDLGIIKELRKHTNAVFRVDANAAWTAEETLEKSKELKTLGVEFIEQPLHPEDWEGMKYLYDRSELPLIADESCIKENDVEKCKGYFHGINIKLAKCGGITPAKRMIKKSRELDMKVMIGCMTESSIGISAIAHLSPLLDFVDMDGPLLIINDIAEGVKLKKDGIEFPLRNGTGIKMLK